MLFRKLLKRIVVSTIDIFGGGQRKLSMMQLHKSRSHHVTNEVYNHVSNSTRKLYRFSQWMCLMVMDFNDMCVLYVINQESGHGKFIPLGVYFHLVLVVSRDEIKHSHDSEI